MKKKISHSAITKYQMQPMLFKYHYIDRLRPVVQSSALLFGSAVDLAIQELLQTKDLEKAKKVFNNNWEFAEINKVKEYLPTTVNIKYSESEWDKELLTDEAKEELCYKYGLTWYSEMDRIIHKKKEVGYKNLEINEKSLFNHCNWQVLNYKGQLMLEAVNKKILPRIKEVLGIQVEVSLNNPVTQDSLIGYADLVAKFDDYTMPIFFDWKTSVVKYKAESVKESAQLALYMHSLQDKFENSRTAGFIVLNKRINKNKEKTCLKCGNISNKSHKTCNANLKGERCHGEWSIAMYPECEIDVIIDDIPLATEDTTLDNIAFINNEINKGVFICDFKGCCKYGPCEYVNKCRHDSNEGLVFVPESKNE